MLENGIQVQRWVQIRAQPMSWELCDQLANAMPEMRADGVVVGPHAMRSAAAGKKEVKIKL